MCDPIFSSANIILPAAKSAVSPEKWAVIACDQYTSQKSYWDSVREIVGSSKSTLDFILPEFYLGTEEFEEIEKNIVNNMNDKAYFSDSFRTVSGFVYIERTLDNGMVRKGIVGKIDLEHYEYDRMCDVMPTEKTVLERIPPRVKMRSAATVEFPHIMIFVEDRTDLFRNAANLSSDNIIYDFELMLGGGHLKGFSLESDAAVALQKLIIQNEQNDGIKYAVGDGNHSLAAAKAHYENIKKQFGNDALAHPSRYALCEIVSLDDESIIFEPIHRVIFGSESDDFTDKLSDYLETQKDKRYSFEMIYRKNGKTERVLFDNNKSENDMTLYVIQPFIDDYIKAGSGVKCDYIHDDDVLEELASKNGNIGIKVGVLNKSELFSKIVNGPLPRKSFSMGNANSKRFYMEGRKII